MAERKPRTAPEPLAPADLEAMRLSAFAVCPDCQAVVCVRLWKTPDAQHAGPWWETLPAPVAPIDAGVHQCAKIMQ